jgi:NAD(P)-dependent dehydrogenase (short-subunit alcohol dehydrogenase family)
MPQPLIDRHAVITGGGRGIGRAIAEKLAALGASLTLIGRDRAQLFEAVQTIGGASVCDVQVCDVRDEAQVTRAFTAIAESRHRVSILINNAGVAKAAKFSATDPRLWHEMVETNLTGTYLCTRAVLPALLEAPMGTIVNIASTAGLVGYPNIAAYCASKHGVVGLTRALARELASTRVTVNAVCPGYVDTDMAKSAVANIVAKSGKSESEARDMLASRNPQRRLIAPAEVAATVAWLCLPETRSITGQAISVSGGEVLVG